MSDLSSYAVPVEGHLAFVREQIRLSDGRRVGEAIGSDPWIERDVLRPVFERDEEGLPRHKLVYLELPRGHWKSGAVAAIACTEAVLNASTDIVVAAADQDQARIVGENLDGYLARNPALRASFTRRGDSYLIPARGSRIRIISSDAASSWGHGGTHRRFRVVADELTAWPAGGGRELWTSLVSATGKVADAQTIIVANAGFDAESSWQWEVRETASAEKWAYLFSAAGPIASWISPAWIAQMRALLPGPAFDRAILNVWVSQSGDFVTREQWRRCVDPDLRPQTSGSGGRYFAGLDLGLTKDRTALAIVHADRLGSVILDELLVWQGSRDAHVAIGAVEHALIDATRRFPGLRIAADPWQFQSSIQRLRAAGVAIAEHVFSATSVARLSNTIYSLISDARLRVFEDADLEREVLGLRVTQTASGWRVDHRAGGYSDRVIALGLAAQQAATLGANSNLEAHVYTPTVLPEYANLASSPPPYGSIL